MKTFLSITFILCLIYMLKAQNYKEMYGVEPLQDIEKYHQWAKENPSLKLIEIKNQIPNIQLDIRYATNNNFMKKKMYREARAFCPKIVLDSLKIIQKELEKKGCGLKIFDAYRPYSVTVQFYEQTNHSNFVADPKKGSKHNRGCAIDLSIINLKTHKELEMPTDFDAFTKLAHPKAKLKNKVAEKNRDVLIQVMQSHGFQVDPIEWWHFNFKNYTQLGIPILDIPFDKL